MTDDESFTRAIVAAPGDDAPRLVYADWLDERGDPRGDYLRAELVAGQWLLPEMEGISVANALRRSGQGLDAVWVARVSRPPAGVCCVRLRFEGSGPPITYQQIARFARQYGVRLPADYCAFLWNYNGGRPVPNLLAWADDQSDFGWRGVRYFYPLVAQDQVTVHHGILAEALIDLDERREAVGALGKTAPIALRVGQLVDGPDDSLDEAVAVMSLEPDRIGRISHRFHDGQTFEEMHELAPSFTAYISWLDRPLSPHPPTSVSTYI